MRKSDIKETLIAALDIGGTSVKAAAVKDGRIVCRANIATDISGGIKTILASVEKALNNLDLKEAEGIAISSAGDINPYKGVCLYATSNLPGYSGFNIKEYFENKYGKITSVINDGHAALLAELLNPCLKSLSPVIMLTLGTGVGGAYSENGEIVFGDDYTFGRFGHIIMKQDGFLCGCGKYGCIEEYISAKGLMRLVKEKDINITNARELFLYAANGDKFSKDIIDCFIQEVISAVKVITGVYPARAVIFGGGLSEASGMWIDKVQAAFSDIIITPAVYKNDAGVLGAYEWWNKLYGNF